jgi:hypothetical protein
MEKDPATPITATITASNDSGANLVRAVIQITGNYQKRQDVLSFANVGKIKGKWDAKTGKLTLSGSDTVANYQKALRVVKYRNTSENPNTDVRTVTFLVSDGSQPSNAATRSISVKAVNDAPVLAGIEPTALSYPTNQSTAPITATITARDADSANLAGATVQITKNYKKGQDVLSFVDTTSIKGKFDPKTGKLTLSGSDTVADYEAALRAVTYQNTSPSPNMATRTVTFKVSDGLASSKGVTRTIQLTNSVVTTGSASSMAAIQGTKPAANDAALLAMLWPFERPDGLQGKKEHEGLVGPAWVLGVNTVDDLIGPE